MKKGEIMQFFKNLMLGGLSALLFLGTVHAAEPHQTGTYMGAVTLETINLGTGKIDKSPFDMSINVAGNNNANMTIGAVNYGIIPAAIGMKHGGFSFSSGAHKHGSVIFKYAGKGKSIKGLYQYADSLTLQTIRFKLKKM